MSAYEQSLAVLHEALQFGIEPSLVGITALTRSLGNPQNRYASIQIAGTNGKSSTARFTAAFLHSQGKKVGLYTSPELVDYPERMEIDGEVVSQERFAEAILKAHSATLPSVTEFELLTAAALWLFAEERVDYAVLEVGLGGRWDATSIVQPQVAVITGVDFDHTDILGDTLEEIAAEKAAIIKPGTVPILGPGTEVAREVFLARCAETQTEPRVLPPVPPAPRFPRYQQRNIACALAATEAALGTELDLVAIQRVLDTLSIPGRFETLREQPLLLIDASHNPESARYLAQALIERFTVDPATQRLRTVDTLLLGILSNKDAAGIIAALAPLFEHVAVTRSASPRAIPPDELAESVANGDGRQPEVFPSVSSALDALTARNAAVVATGSITLAGEVKALAAKWHPFR
jgi:dihydrofolate synthase/folylpolyglutamate synthase